MFGDISPINRHWRDSAGAVSRSAARDLPRVSRNFYTNKTYVYILTNQHGNVMYVGCTDDLKKRMYFHKNRLIEGFTKKYNVHKLVYFEAHDRPDLAYTREVQVKKYRREKKDHLVDKMNPKWIDLSIDLCK